MSEQKRPRSIRVGTANEMRFAKFLLSHAMSVPEAMARFMAGPPMTEQDRFHQQAAESRIKTGFRRPVW